MALTPKRILVPTDFSPASDCALRLARALADPFKAEIHLLHVGIVVDDPIANPADLDEVERILAMSDARTQRALEELAKAIDAPTHCHVKRRVASADAIIEGISEFRCDLVIMGTHGRRGLKSVLMGSVAKEIVQRSPVPVLTTRAEAGSAFPPKKILVAYDSSEDSLKAVLLAAEWASLLSAKITLLHALEPVTYPDFYALPAVSEGHLIPTSQQCHEALAKVAKEHLAEVPYETAVIRARAADGITKYAAKHGFHLVVLATRGISGITHVLFGSVAERVTQLCEVPVLTTRRAPQTPTPESKKKRNLQGVLGEPVLVGVTTRRFPSSGSRPPRWFAFTNGILSRAPIWGCSTVGGSSGRQSIGIRSRSS